MTAAARTAIDDAIPAFKEAVGDGGWTTDQDEIAPHVVEDRGLYRGVTPLLLKPSSTEQLARIVGLCHEKGIAIVPQAGNTSLCGGSTPHDDGSEVIVSVARMNRIREIDAVNYTMTAEAGCILANLQDAADEADRFFPLSLAAEGTCQIGGNLSTNAGGINVLRYGNARELVLGLEVVLPNGEVWNGLRSLRKDNTGYDLKQLFLGAEGTLGIITAAVLKLFPKPRDIQTAFVAVPDPEAALELLARARAGSGDTLSCFELIPRIAIDFALRHIPGVQDPLSEPHPWYVLMELSSSAEGEALRDTLEGLFEGWFEQGLVLDATLAASGAQRQQLWHIRESLPEAQKPEGGSIKHDVSVPVSRVAEFIARGTEATEKAIPGSRVMAFGHAGDGNIHFNVSQPEGADRARFLGEWKRLNRIIHDIVADMDGSFSAEHGVGRLKLDDVERYKSPIEINLMRSLKQAIDPKGIMNPGKVVP